MKKLLLIFVLIPTIALSEMVTLCVSVHDIEGLPIENAEVCLSTKKKRMLPYESVGYEDIFLKTGSDGVATGQFQCWNGRVLCSVKAVGFYEETLPDIVYSTEYNARKKETVFLEDKKAFSIKMFPRLNPIPLYSYMGNVIWKNFGTNKVERCGYDLKVNDWVFPVGRGKVADFFLTHIARLTDGILESEGVIEFQDGSGGYIVHSKRNDGKLIVYSAETNRSYQTYFSATRIKKFDGDVIRQTRILEEGECLIMRTRVKRNAKGEIVSCNYSKIYGPFEIAGLLRFKQSSFNDTSMSNNLEFDTRQNLGTRRIGCLQP